MLKSFRVPGERYQNSCSWLWTPTWVLAALLAAPGAKADPAPEPTPGAPVETSNPDLARSVAVTGREAFNSGDYETALALFRRAYSLYPAPTVVLYEARSLEKLGRLLEADEAYTRTAQLSVGQDAPAQFAEAIAQARQEERALRARIPTLTVEVQGVSANDPNLAVTVNGRAIGAAQLGQAQHLNPGAYQIAGALGTARADQSEVRLTAGQHARVVLNLAAPSLPPPAPAQQGSLPAATPSSTSSHMSTGRLLAYVSGGVGVAALGTGIITGLESVNAHTQAEHECPNRLCDEDGIKQVNSFHSLRTVSSVFYGVGIAGLAAGAVLWFTSSPDTSETASTPAVAPWADARSVGLQGSF
jgi:hypothetical protein